jgi:hyperosmotically inducible protein
MKKITLFSTAGILALASIGCSTAANNTTAVGRTNATNATVNSSNTATVVNAQGNMETGAMNSNSMSANTMNANITRADYDRDKDRYAQEAKQAGRTIGTGANDGWLWTKTRAALATTANLRDSTINVDVSNAVVTLTGTVATAAQKEQAAAAAKGIEGVTSVTNNLKVQANDSLTNQAVGTNTTTTNANKK